MTRPARRLRTAALHFGFGLTGTATALLGPILPELSRQWRLADGEAGLLFTAQFLGAMAAALAASAVMMRFGVKNSIAGALALVAGGFLAAALAGWPAILGAVACYGAGLGLAIPAISLAVAEMKTGRSAASLNLLNFTWCAGAVLAPPVGAVLVAQSARMLFSAMAGAAMVAALAAVAVVERSPQSPERARTRRIAKWEVRSAVLTAVLIFLYVGTEVSISGWAPLWAYGLGARGDAAVLPASCFWAGILLARLFAPAVLRSLTPSATILAGIGLSGAAVAAIFVLQTFAALLAGAAVSGLGLGVVFPTAIAVFCDALATNAVRLVNIVFASGALGGATVPLLTGWASRSGHARGGLAVAIVCIAAMALLQLDLRTSLRRRAAEGTSGFHYTEN